jgi:hypothetical protein
MGKENSGFVFAIEIGRSQRFVNQIRPHGRQRHTAIVGIGRNFERILQQG